MQDNNLKDLMIGGRTFSNRLLLGTGKFSSNEVMKGAIEASGTEMVTIALRRVDLKKPKDNILSYIDRSKVELLPNTSGSTTAEEAIRIARIAREALETDFIKIEVTPNVTHLLPCPIETLKATEVLAKEGFKVLAYMNLDAPLAKRLENAGAAAVMPLAAPIGTNKGIISSEILEIIIENASVPVVVDAGLGAASHATRAIELGADAVLVNTAIATARDPISQALAFKYAIIAGLYNRKGEPLKPLVNASPSSPLINISNVKEIIDNL